MFGVRLLSLSVIALASAVVMALNLLGMDRAEAAERKVDWAVLLPTVTEHENDPFASLTKDQRWKLAMIKRYRRLGLSTANARRQAVEKELETAGIDIDALLSHSTRQKRQRRDLARSVNSAAVGLEIEITGYPVLAGPSEDDQLLFYLVGDARYCSHVSLPSPNQIILVSSSQIDLALNHLTPVRVRGVIEEAHSNQVVHFVDGLVAVEAVYAMSSATIDHRAPPASAPRGGLIRLVE